MSSVLFANSNKCDGPYTVGNVFCIIGLVLQCMCILWFILNICGVKMCCLDCTKFFYIFQCCSLIVTFIVFLMLAVGGSGCRAEYGGHWPVYFVFIASIVGAVTALLLVLPIPGQSVIQLIHLIVCAVEIVAVWIHFLGYSCGGYWGKKSWYVPHTLLHNYIMQTVVFVLLILINFDVKFSLKKVSG